MTEYLPHILIGSFIVSQFAPPLGQLNARLFQWLADTQRSHSTRLARAYLAYCEDPRITIEIENCIELKGQLCHRR